MNLEGFLAYIQEIPIINTPDVFGLHPNAEITYFTNGAKLLWSNLLSMQVTSGGDTGGINKDDYVSKIANDIEEKMPIEFDVLTIRNQTEKIDP
jgi:dynein heavy chain